MLFHRLSRYLAVEFCIAFCVSMLLVTFAMVAGALYKAVGIMSQGIGAGIVGRFLINNIPYTLSYSIPISALFSTLLLFGRLSADSELSAMKSGGLSTWQIASPLLLIATGLSALCLYNNCVIYPATEYSNRKLLKGLGVEDPVKLLEEGRFIRDFPGYLIYIGNKHRNKVKDLVVYEIDKDTGRATSTLRADEGMISMDDDKTELRIDLFDARIEVPDPEHPDSVSKTHFVNARKLPIRIDVSELVGRKEVSKKRLNMQLPELIYRIRHVADLNPMLNASDRAVLRSQDLVHTHQRLCLAMAPLTFVMLAIPLGVRTHRKESSMGMLLSLAVMFVFYLFIIVSDTLDSRPALHPWLFPWFAILGFQLTALLLFRRVD